MRSSDHCFKEKHSFIQTEVKAANTTFTYSKCLEQDGENKGLLSYFVPENFIGFKCPKVEVHFNKVNLPRVSNIEYNM